MRRAVIYARVSGDDSKYATSGIESQLTDCRKYAEQKGYQNIGEYFETPDKRTSGADWLPEIESILRLAQQEAFDVLVVREVDRLARNRFKQMNIEIDLEAHGVEVEYVIGQYENTAEGRLLKGMVSEFAEYERQKTRERTRRGILRSVAAKNVTIGGCNAPYGYDMAQEDGRRVLVINETEANIVRVIFDLYANHLYSLQGIGEYLDEHKIPKPAKASNHKKLTTKAKWSVGTIGRILNNETYIGRWYYRKTKRVKQLDGTYRNMPRPRDEWMLIEVPAILPEPVFKVAQKRREANKRIKSKNRCHTYALSGIMTCAICGNGISGITSFHNDKPYQYYRCNARHQAKRYGFKCENPQAKVAEVDAAIWQWVAGILLSPEKLREAWHIITRPSD